MRNWPELWSQCLSCALSQPLPLPTKARLCPRKEGSPALWHLTHRAASASCSGARVSGGQTEAPRSPASPLQSARVSLRRVEPMRALEEVCSAPRTDWC